MLSVTVLNGLGSNILDDCPSLDYPHQRIALCLDRGWTDEFNCKDESNSNSWWVPNLLDCLPEMIAKMVADSIVDKPWPLGWTQKQKDAAIKVAGRVVLELPLIFNVGRTQAVRAARVAAASALADPKFGGRWPTQTAAMCITALETESDIDVAPFLLKALAFNLRGDVPPGDELQQRGLLSLSRIANSGDTLSKGISQLAQTLLKQLQQSKPPVPVPPVPPVPGPPDSGDSGTSPKPTTKPAVPGYTKPLVIISAIGAGVLLGLAAWHTAAAVKKPRSRPIRRVNF